jgi:hypothetical protein
MNKYIHRAAALTFVLISSNSVHADKTVTPLHALSFDVCHRQGCAERAVIQLTADESQSITLVFAEPAATAEQERAAITRAISRFEQLIGSRTGTDRDLGGTFPGAFRAGQMDCIDESTNTTTYLHLLEKAGLLVWHEVLTPSTRLPIPRGWWPHTSAVIRERASGTKYVVDSWFEDNGKPPHIVELSVWKQGWKPAPEAATQ